MCFNLRRAWWPSEVERAAIAVIYSKDKIGRGDHVKIKIYSDLFKLLWRTSVELGDIIRRAKQAELFSTPEEESDSV